jgi:SPP1 gp7 family putative phage head morphogenesis protein
MSFDKMRIFLEGIGESQAGILRSILTPFQNSILNMVRNGKDYATIVKRVGNKASLGIFFNDNNVTNMQRYLKNIEKAVAKGSNSPLVGPGLTQASRAKVLDMVKQSSLDQLTKLQADVLEDVADALKTGIANKLTPQQISQQLQQQFGMHQNRANMIARTETNRAVNMTRYAQGVQNGAKFFVVQSRAAACKYCFSKYEGEIFDITDTFAIPPLHVNCKCIAAFFKTLDEAGAYAAREGQVNVKVRNDLLEQGYNIQADGTQPTRSTQYRIGLKDGPNKYFKNYQEAIKYVRKNPGKVTYVLSERIRFGTTKPQKIVRGTDKIDRFGPMTIPRSELYAKTKLMYKKVRSPLLEARHKLQRPLRAQTIKDIKAGKATPYNKKKVNIPKGERRVYDLHSHTTASSDGKQTLKSRIKEAKKLGLDGIGITDHNVLMSNKLAKQYSTKNFKVIPGVEITTTKGHMIAYGITKPIRPMMSPRATAMAIKAQGGTVILPHSMAKYRDGILYSTGSKYIKNFPVDAIESVNSRYGQGMTNYRSREVAEKYGIPQVGGSDGHSKNTIAMALTEVQSKNNSIDEILGSIKAGRVNAYDSQVPTMLWTGKATIVMSKSNKQKVRIRGKF